MCTSEHRHTRALIRVKVCLALCRQVATAMRFDAEQPDSPQERTALAANSDYCRTKVYKMSDLKSAFVLSVRWQRASTRTSLGVQGETKDILTLRIYTDSIFYQYSHNLRNIYS